jgi:glycosyltransferase involved in cell wall biosynthesis
VIDGLALPAFGPALAAGNHPGPVIALIHHPLALEAGLEPGQARRLDHWEAQALQRVDAVVVTSSGTRAMLVRRGVATAPLHVALPGIDHPARRLPRLPRRGPVWLLCVATLTPRKGHLRLLAALRGVRHLAWRLVCVGGERGAGNTARRIRASRDRSGWRQRVRLAGEVDAQALTQHYRQADLFVFASRLEGYGMALAEAMAHGLPVVTTRGGAIAQTVPATAGIRVHGADPRALQRALAQALGAPRLRRRWAAQARCQRRRLGCWKATAAVFHDLMQAIENTAHDG